MFAVLEPCCEVGDVAKVDQQPKLLTLYKKIEIYAGEEEDILRGATRDIVRSCHLSRATNWAVHGRRNLLQ